MSNNHLILSLIFTTMSFSSLAQTGGNYEIIKSTIANGGGLSSGGDFSLESIVGQVDATAEMSGGGYSFIGGIAGNIIPQNTGVQNFILNSRFDNNIDQSC
jgi:hypothetical protein